MNKLYLFFIIIFLFSYSGCSKDTPTETDTQAPTVSILFLVSGLDIKADTTYTIIADANDNIKVLKVDFYISGQYAESDSLSPYEYRWNTQGLTSAVEILPTIMAKAYDEAGNIGTSVLITLNVNGAANHAPALPSNPNPADGSIAQILNPTLSWSCNDPDGDGLTYDIILGTSSNPTTVLATNQSTTSIIPSGLSENSKYFWKVNARDSKGAITAGPDWNFTTINPRPFVFPLKVGTTWRYRYLYGGYWPGLHVWKVIGIDESGNWNCIDIRTDTVSNQINKDTVSFVIRSFPDYLKIEFPEWKGFSDSSRIVPKFIDVAVDTIRINKQVCIGTCGSERVVYVNGVGIVEYYHCDPGMTAHYYSQSLSLIDYFIP